MHWWWDHGWGMGWMMLAWPLLILAFVALGWYFLARARPGLGQAPDSPELLLKRRYARGEIDREEYERRLEDLRR